MSEQPELRWAPMPPAPQRRGRVWIIVALSVLAVAIVGAVLWFLLFRGGAPAAEPTPTPTASATSTGEPAPGATETAQPTDEPAVTAPPVPDPDLGTFITQVKPRLDDAGTGLGMLDGASSTEAVQVVDQLQQDAGRLAEAAAPRAIATDWYAAVTEYSEALSTLRSAVEDGSGTTAAVDGARERLQALRDLLDI